MSGTLAGRKPKTHDFTQRVWGHNYYIHRIENDGHNLGMSIISDTWLHVGDYIILGNKNSEPVMAKTTRYRLTATSRPAFGPDDLFHCETEFAPREGDDREEAADDE